jgi:hypothetical protein
MLQYNLRTLMGTTVVIALATWILFVLPSEIGIILMLLIMMLVANATLAGVIYFRRYAQAFCIGSLPCHALMLMTFFFGAMGPWGIGPGDQIEFKVGLIVCLLVTFASGFVAMGVRWLALRMQQQDVPKAMTALSTSQPYVAKPVEYAPPDS